MPTGLSFSAVAVALIAAVIEGSVGEGIERRMMQSRLLSTVDASVRLMMPSTAASLLRSRAYGMKRPTDSEASTPRTLNWIFFASKIAVRSGWSAEFSSVTVWRVSLGPGSTVDSTTETSRRSPSATRWAMSGSALMVAHRSRALSMSSLAV